MAKRLQLRRGTTTEHASFTGAAGEVTVDEDKNTVVVHDGATAGGEPLAKEGTVNQQNLITNSGFDVWSNSTLENATGTDLHTGWDSHNFNTLTDSGTDGDVDSAINLSGVSVANGNTFSVTAGKLYMIRATLTLNSGSEPFFDVYNGAGSEQITLTRYGAGAWTAVWKEPVGGTGAYIRIYSTAAANFTLLPISVYEVTPGCIAANNLAMDGWFKGSTTDILRQHNDGGTLTHDGSFYGLFMDWAAAGNYVQWPSLATRGLAQHYQRFAGRTVTFGCWMKTSKASHGKVTIEDNSGTVATSSLHTGGGGWEWLEITHTMGGSITLFSVLITGAQAVDGTNTDIYASQPMLVFGSSIGEGNYTRPMSEIIYLEGECSLVDLNASSHSTHQPAFNLEVESRGKLPKSIKAIVSARMDIRDSASSSSNVVGYLYPGTGYENGFAFNIGTDGLTLGNDDVYAVNLPYMKTLDAGFTANLTASGSSTLDIDMFIRAIEI